MTHGKSDAQKMAELGSAFLSLNDRGKDSALAILRTLSFAQAAMGADACGEAENTVRRQPTRAG